MSSAATGGSRRRRGRPPASPRSRNVGRHELAARASRRCADVRDHQSRRRLRKSRHQQRVAIEGDRDRGRWRRPAPAPPKPCVEIAPRLRAKLGRAAGVARGHAVRRSTARRSRPTSSSHQSSGGRLEASSPSSSSRPNACLVAEPGEVVAPRAPTKGEPSRPPRIAAAGHRCGPWRPAVGRWTSDAATRRRRCACLRSDARDGPRRRLASSRRSRTEVRGISRSAR